MHKLLLTTVLIAITFGAGLSRGATYDNAGDNWIRVEACSISFLIPRNLKRTSREGVDSCVAEFTDDKMTLSIDHGWYGGPGTNPHAEQAQNKDIEFVGTVTKIYPVEGLLERWAILVHVDRVVSGEFSGTTFTFAIHSPSQAGLKVGRAYPVKAKWTDKGYVVDEPSLTEMRTEAKPSSKIKVK